MSSVKVSLPHPELEDAADARARIERVDDFFAENAAAFRDLREKSAGETRATEGQKSRLAAPFIVPDAPTDLRSRIQTIDRQLAPPPDTGSRM